jgi:hypothetical protein
MGESSSSLSILPWNPSLDIPSEFLDNGFKPVDHLSGFDSSDLQYAAIAESDMAPNLTNPFLTSIGQLPDQELVPVGQINLQGDASVCLRSAKL